MKAKKILLVSALFALLLTGCGKKNQEPEPAPEPEEQDVDPATPEGKATVKDALYNAYLNYSTPSTFKAVNVNAEAKDVNFDLGLDITEKSQYGENKLDFSVSDFNAKVDAYAKVGEGNVVEGMVKASDVKGKVSLDANVLKELPKDPEPEPEAQQQGLIKRDGEEQPEENPLFEGFSAKGEFTIAPLAVNAYFKDGNLYLDYSDAGVRTTLDNADDLAMQIMELVGSIDAYLNPDEDEGQQAQQQGLIKRDGEEPLHFLNGMIDELTGAPGRKIYDLVEEDGFVIDSEDMVAPTEEEKTQAKETIGEFVDNILSVSPLIFGVKELKDGSYKFSINLTKELMIGLISLIEQFVAAQEALEQAQQPQQQGLIKRDGEEAAKEPTIADYFKQYCEKFTLKAELILSKEGFVKSASADFDIKASAKELPYSFFGLFGEITASLTFKGKFSASFKYNDEVSFQLPTDLNTYVFVGKQEAYSY